MANFFFNMDRQRPGHSAQAGFIRASLKAASASETPRANHEIKEQRINFHIGTINALLRAQGRPELSAADHAKVHAAAEGTPGISSEAIMQAVLTAASSTMAANPHEEFKKFLQAKGIDEASYHAAIAKHGATLGNLDAIFAAAGRARGGGGHEHGGSGNMSNGVGNSNAGYGGIGSSGSAAGYITNGTGEANLVGASYVSGPAAMLNGIGGQPATNYNGAPISNITLGNYVHAGAQFRGTGMTYGSFDALRKDPSNFNGKNILHAGEDAGKHALGGANNIPAAKAYAVLDKHDGARRQQRDKLNNEYDAGVKSNPQTDKAVREYLAAETEPERKAALDKISHINAPYAARLAEHTNAAPNDASKRAGVVADKERIKRTIAEKALKLAPEVSGLTPKQAQQRAKEAGDHAADSYARSRDSAALKAPAPTASDVASDNKGAANKVDDAFEEKPAAKTKPEAEHPKPADAKAEVAKPANAKPANPKAAPKPVKPPTPANK